MRIVIQRVLNASVTIEGKITSSIANGLLVLVGIEDADTDEDIAWITTKVTNLRIFDDAHHIPNLSVKETGGEILLVSQFTLQGSVKKGNRPSYIKAAKPEISIPIYEKLIGAIESELQKKICTGTFGADMKVSLINDGPFTIIADSKKRD